MDKENWLCQVCSMISYFVREKSGQGQEPILMKKKKHSKIILHCVGLLPLCVEWIYLDISKCLLYDQWVCSTIRHCSQLQENLVDSWSYTLVAYIVVIRRKFPNESSYHNTEQTALTLVIYKICPSLYYNFQIQWRRTNLAVIEVNEQRCIHIFFFFFLLKKCN